MSSKALCLVAGLMIGLTAQATSAQRSASDSYIQGIQNQALGSGYSVGNIVNSIKANSRAQAATNGIGNFQVTNTSISSGVGRTPSSAGIPTVPSAGRSGGSKPFSTLNRGPTVSPYLNLFNTGIGGTASTIDNYNVLVRPQLQQQRTNRQLQRQTQQLNQRVQAISARPDFNAQGSDQIMATGHSTVFGYYSRFYPSKNRRR